MENELPAARESHRQGRWLLRHPAEPGLSEDAVESENGGRSAVSSLTRSLLAFAFILLILGVLPASFVLWGCLMTLIFSLCRVRLHAQQLAIADQEDLDLVPAVSPMGRLRPRSPGPVIRILPGGAGFLMLNADPHTALQRINAQLRQLDEEMGAADYDTLLRLGLHPSAMPPARVPPVSDQDIATLPCHPYKPPRSSQQPQQPQPSTLPPPSAQQPQSAAHSRAGPQAPAPQPAALPGPAACCAGGPHANRAASAGECGSCPTSGRHASSCCGGGEGANGGGVDGSELTCSVCLDTVEEGAIVMTLPCLHQFHASCITPWLRQKGLHASCPMCKTPVFR
ncbi:hypothetical protein HYH03_016965 [Edaphochlamys debaryana]|uniref:RING-type E3 ubiquitin transferase n=1 Tax=Edaphochlamys debaryana TaxID=47281 RepID=A0A835XIW8_9CHLO|nr:hypothetical protein HYH03_016965 [Edaphochlamys debaryana]|eukprot:KAG2484230.1 hypothetical protein HYH03_016965 [Edaphochlamys debaryana]